ncbi:MAG: serine hydrolase, partial [Acidobacteria bacterium]
MTKVCFRFLLLFLLISFIVHAEPKELKGLDSYITKAMTDWKVPGFALAVVKDDKVVFSKCYGVRKYGETNPVDERTMFAIASLTKAFTAASIAMLVDEGKLKWDDPATKYLPGFQLYDPYVTREITIRDLLSHRSGLGAYAPDLLWLRSTLSRADILNRIRYLKPETSFRSAYAYSNIMVLAGGEIIPSVTGKSWDQFVRERIFTPLGMASSNTSIQDLKGENVASPHIIEEKKVKSVPFYSVDNLGAAGAINSNLADMTKWLRFQLSDGSFEGKQLIKKESMEEMHSPQTIIRIGEMSHKDFPDTHFGAYGLCWRLRDYHGKLMVFHAGAVNQMTSYILLLPEEKLGIVALTNMSGTSMHSAIAYRIVDAYLGAPSKDWSADFLKEDQEDEQKHAEIIKNLEQTRIKDTKPSLPLSG